MQESINAGFAAPTILIDYATAARQPFPSPLRPSISLLASSERRGGRSFCAPVKGKPMPFDTNDVGHLYELIAAFDSRPPSRADMRRGGIPRAEDARILRSNLTHPAPPAADSNPRVE